MPLSEIKEVSLLHQIMALVVSFIIFLLAYALVTFILVFLNGNVWIQVVFRDVFAPFMGAYIGITTALSFFKKATSKFVCVSFAIILLFFAGYYFGFVGVYYEEAGDTFGGYIWGGVTILVGIFGALKVYMEDEN